MPELSWYAGRAATMSPREMVWRAKKMGEVVIRRDVWLEPIDSRMLRRPVADWDALRQRFRDGDGRPVLLDQERARRIAAEQPAHVRAVLAEADRCIAGERAFFGYPSVNIGRYIDWSYDPITDFRWPESTGGRIDHREAVSDPKWIWELNRLQHLPVLAQAWLFTGESPYAETAFDHLESWLDQNPAATATMWRSPFEVGLRAISVAIALQGLRNSPAMTTQRYRRVVRMLDASARHCWHNRSRFSSANNHLVGELTGLLTVHLLFPELAAPASLQRRAVRALEAAAEQLILPDGAGAEQSISYQIFTAELFSTLAALWRLRGDRVPAPIGTALARSARYLVSVVGSGDPDPRYGDDDDGFALRLGAEPKRTVRAHLGIVAATTGDESAARYGEMTTSAAWFAAALGTSVRGIGKGVGRGGNDSSMYAPNGGLVVLRQGRNRLTMDVGPLGYLSTAAHGHADALSVTLSDGDGEIIVDPGTGSYCMNPDWRAVHRGTRAHPTVCVDGANQSVIGGPFYWRRHAATTARSVDLENGVVDAEHDGYRRLDDPVTHRRWLIAAPGEPTVVVVDLLDGKRTHDIAVSWPLHPALDWLPTQDGHMVSRDGIPVLQLCYAATTPVETGQVRGDTDSGLGWWSDRLESREPAWLLTAHTGAGLPVALVSFLHTVDAGVIALPQITRSGEQLSVSWSQDGIRRGLTIDTRRSGAVTTVPCPSIVSSTRRW